MRKLILLAALVLLGLLAPPASAVTRPQERRALSIATDYWHSAPPCGLVTQTWSSTLPAGWEATATPQCQIVYNAAYGSQMPWATFCQTTIHEYGHLVLGVRYFAAVNPNDPAHSPDPANVMSQGGGMPLDVCRPPAPPVVQDRVWTPCGLWAVTPCIAHRTHHWRSK